jgi:hypothetical protein
MKDKICEELGFTAAGTAVKSNRKCYSVAKIAINKMPSQLAKQIAKDCTKLADI